MFPSLVPLFFGDPAAVTIPAAEYTPLFTDPDSPGDDANVGSDVLALPNLDQSMTPVSDSRVVSEAVARRFLTPRGALTFHPDYGYDLRANLNDDIDDAALYRIKSELEMEAGQEERVAQATAEVSYDARTQALTTNMSGLIASGVQFKFTLSVTQLTDTLLVED
jgi:phage baseplate assembly protein W